MSTEAKNNNQLGIRGRLIIGFSAVIAFFITSIIVSIVIMNDSKNLSQRVIQIELPKYDSLIDLNSTIYHAQSSMRGLVLDNTLEERKDFSSTIILLQDLTNEISLNSKNWVDEELIKTWQQMKPILLQLIEQYNLISTTVNNNVQINSNSISKANALTGDVLLLLAGPMSSNGARTGGFLDKQHSKLESGSYAIISNINMILIVEYIVTFLGILASIFIVFATSRSIIRHINIFREYSNRIASGDFRHTLSVHGTDEIANLGSDLNSMTENLSSITKQIAVASHNIFSTLEEVKQAVNVQSAGASEQASSINEVTASLEEIEKSSEQTMEKAKMLGDVAEKTRAKGQQGLESVEKSIQGMKSVRNKVQLIAQTILDLSNQTQQVGEITSVVSSLAQQSKMLALNASIEAAKAGDAGRGFAVVAAEVKTLAEQSEQSTAQVQKILEDIRRATEKAVMVTEEGTKGVDYGTNLVEQTGEIVRGLSDVIHQATLASQQIEAAVRQEGVGIEQITAGMNEINQVTTSFVASAQQTLEAITQLSEISRQLKERVDTYKIQ